MSFIKQRSARPAAWACVLATLASGPLASVRVRAQDVSADADPNAATDRARVHFKNGVDFYRERNFRAALIEFKRAYKAAPHYKLLYNLGQASLELQEDSSAIDYFTSYLEEGQNELDAERKREVAQTIVRLQARLGTAIISVDQPGAEIYVDQTLLGTTPLSGPMKVSVGRRRFTAVKHGFTTAERIMEVAAGDHVTIALELKPSTQDISVLQKALEAHNDATHDGSLSPAAWTAIGTAALALGGGTMTVLTVLAQKDYDNERKRMTSAAQLATLRDDAKLKALITDITWGATIAAGSVAAILFFTNTGTERADDAKTPSGIDVELGLGNVVMNGRF
jgi:tetratricopeptide (TPR) repeat protein